VRAELALGLTFIAVPAVVLAIAYLDRGGASSLASRQTHLVYGCGAFMISGIFLCVGLITFG
jgi:hypothetical protein